MCVSGYLFISGKIKMDIMKFTKITYVSLKMLSTTPSSWHHLFVAYFKIKLLTNIQPYIHSAWSLIRIQSNCRNSMYYLPQFRNNPRQKHKLALQKACREQLILNLPQNWTQCSHHSSCVQALNQTPCVKSVCPHRGINVSYASCSSNKRKSEIFPAH